ncbi:MAG: restriction endonuclease, SacI family [Dokdonella sp.]
MEKTSPKPNVAEPTPPISAAVALEHPGVPVEAVAGEATSRPKPILSATGAFHDRARDVLTGAWSEVREIADLEKARDANLSDALEQLIRASGSTYPFILLTQVLGKVADSQLNAICIQSSSTLKGAWDARSLAAAVTVPWNKDIANGKPLPGNSDDPYVNNPARYKNFGSEMEAKAKNGANYKALEKIVTHVETSNAIEAARILKLVLVECQRFVESKPQEYYGPPRITTTRIMQALTTYLSDRSGGVRLQIVCYAIYGMLSEIYPGYGEIESETTNTADAASKRTGDIERLVGGRVELAIEIKDRELTSADVEATALKARSKEVTNILFLVHGRLSVDPASLFEVAERHWPHGIDINFSEALPFLEHLLMTLSPEQRSRALRAIHDALHEKGAHFSHVQRWTELLLEIR